MINPNGDEFAKDEPLPGSMPQGGEQTASGPTPRFQPASSMGDAGSGPAQASPSGVTGSTTGGDAWRQTRERATLARQKTEFFLRENPVPTIIGALAIGLAIGLAYRYSTEAEEKKVEAKTPLGNVDLSMLTLPFLWPFFKTVKNRYEDTAEVVKDRVGEGVDRLKKVDVDDYVKPLRKQWRSWTR
jgi:hypothetical protein